MALYDPNEFPEVKSDTDYTLAEFLAWARTKPADEEYNFYDASACAVAQFGCATGRDHLVGIGRLDLDQPILEAAVNAEGPDSWNFGSLVKRLEAMI